MARAAAAGVSGGWALQTRQTGVVGLHGTQSQPLLTAGKENVSVALVSAAEATGGMSETGTVIVVATGAATSLAPAMARVGSAQTRLEMLQHGQMSRQQTRQRGLSGCLLLTDRLWQSLVRVVAVCLTASAGSAMRSSRCLAV